MADELNWSGAFYESLAGSIGRVTRGGPLGMATGVIGEASAAMRGINTPWQGPRTAASLAAAAGGGFVLLNAGRSLVEAVNAAGQEDYGSALTNAAIGVGWYAGGRFALGAMARGLPLEKGALAAYEEAAEAKFAREDPDRYQQIIGRLKKEQNVAQAAADSAAVAFTNTVNPDEAQDAAAQAAEVSAEMTSKPKTRRRRNAGAGTGTAQPAPQAAAVPSAAEEAANLAAQVAATPAANKPNVVGPQPVVTSGGPGRARGGVRGMARRFSVLARRAARRVARRATSSVRGLLF